MNEEEWLPLTQLAKNLPLSVRFIEMMPIGYGNIPQSISNEELKEKIMRYYGNLTEDFRIYGTIYCLLFHRRIQGKYRFYQCDTWKVL